MSSSVWLRIESSGRREVWVRGDEVIAVAVTTSEGYRDKAESYGVSATWFTHDRTSLELTKGIKSRTEAMSVVRRLLQLLASPPDVVGLIAVDGASVTFESMAE